MRAHAPARHPTHIAVMAQGLKAFREAVLHEPLVETVTGTDLFPVFAPTAIDVVNAEKSLYGLRTTRARPSIVIEYSLLVSIPKGFIRCGDLSLMGGAVGSLNLKTFTAPNSIWLGRFGAVVTGFH